MEHQRETPHLNSSGQNHDPKVDPEPWAGSFVDDDDQFHKNNNKKKRKRKEEDNFGL